MVGVAGASLAAPSTADAQVLQRFVLRAEVGVGTMLTDYQRNTDPQRFGGNVMGYDTVNIQAVGRLGFTIFDPLVLQLSFANGFFQTSNHDGTGRVMAFEGGLRVEPRIGRVGRLFFDGNVGYARTGPLERIEVNGAVGFEFNIVPAVSLGPVVRFWDVIQPDTTAPNVTMYNYDATYWSAGLSLSLRVPEPPPPPPPQPDLPDTDCDRVPDRDDLCETVNPGDRPDPRRLGCPLADSDNDAVLDRDDQCPHEPEGDFPDESPNRNGCADPDIDHDTVANPDDLCPLQNAGPIPDAARRGCPDPNPIARLGCNQIEIRQQIHFETGLANVDFPSDPVEGQNNHMILDQVAAIMRHNTTVTAVEVQGHTDNQCGPVCQREGARTFNFHLSEARANAVMTYLVSRGVEQSRLTARGYGLSVPLRPNTSPTGMAANRRVEFRFPAAAPCPVPREIPPREPHRRPGLPVLPPLPPQPCMVPFTNQVPR